jgi:hypothetical protein
MLGFVPGLQPGNEMSAEDPAKPEITKSPPESSFSDIVCQNPGVLKVSFGPGKY